MGMRFNKDEIAAIRRALGLNLRQFAEEAGVTEATASRWESGDRKPSWDAMDKLEVLYAKTARNGRSRKAAAAAT